MLKIGRRIVRRATKPVAAWRRLARPRQPHDRALAFYRDLVPRDALCFDVGANVGNRVELLLELGARVVAVEPQADCVTELDRKFGSNARFTLVATALGAAPGELVLKVPSASTIASLSPEFIEAMQASGRFSQYSWDREIRVPVTTLDALIAEHGVPEFCKIDVEGYEAEVVAGLSQPVPCLSFEYTPELVDVALSCVEHLERLGSYEYNVSHGESMQLVARRWFGAEALRPMLLAERFPSWGDVYARQAHRA